MPRKESFPPKPHEHRGRSRCRYLGQEYYLGAWGSPEADRAYRELVGRLACVEPAALLPPTASPTVADLAAAYLAEQERTRSNLEELYQIRRVVTALVRLHATVRVADYGCRQIEDLQRAMADGSWMTEAERGQLAKNGKPLGWCRNRVNHAVCRVRSMFYWGERRGLVARGTGEHLRLAPALKRGGPVRARETSPRKPAELTDVLRVAERCPDPVQAILGLLWWSGARPSEIARLRTCDVDRAGDVWLYRPADHKTAHHGLARLVALGPEAQRILRPWLRPDAPQAYVFRPVGRNARKDYYDRNRLADVVRRASRQAGASLTCYCLRHAAKRRIAAELGTTAAMAVLGHQDPRTTENYATGVDVDLLRKVARKCG